LLWIFFTSQSTLILDPKIMLNLESVCDTLNRIFGVANMEMQYCQTLLRKFHLRIMAVLTFGVIKVTIALMQRK
jgi:hypothetical protein